MDAQQFANQLQQRKQKNLAFFKRYFPSIHDAFANLSLKNAQLNIDPNTLEVNLVENGKTIYPLNAKEANINEARQFSDAFKPGFMNHPLRRSTPNDFYRGRFAHGSIANFLEAVQPVAEAIKPYTFRESLPQVVFLGSGLGLHISAFLDMRPVKHAVLVEHNPDRFLASLYLTDWEAIITPYIEDQTRSFVLSVGDTTELSEDERVHQGFAGAWNTICLNVPFMPVQTVFYIHQADPFYTKVANRLNDEIEPYINVWGYYDDEVNQLNHLFHNIEQKIPVFKKVDLSGLTKPTIVCGNGPSLDTYLSLIKQHRDKLHVVAAGSATHSLLKNDIYPDFMVTLESDYATYDVFKNIPEEKARKTPVIGAAQIHPKTFELFSDGLMYLKDETTYARLFENNHDTVANGTPSASNSALAVVLDLNLPNVFLVGMDFGFSDRSKTHSDSSFYSEEEKQNEFEAFKKRITAETYRVETNSRGDIYTTPFYNTARIHAQRKIGESGRKDLINLSMGATIKGTIENTPEEFLSFISYLDFDTNEASLFTIVKKQATRITSKEKEKTLKNIENAFTRFRTQALKILKELEPDMESIDIAVFKLNQAITNNTDINVKKLNMFMRGTVWHWIFNYYALCKEFDGDKKLDTFTKDFKKYFGGFINYLPEHFESHTFNRTIDDPKLNLSIIDPEPEIDKWLDKVTKFDIKK